MVYFPILSHIYLIFTFVLVLHFKFYVLFLSEGPPITGTSGCMAPGYTLASKAYQGLDGKDPEKPAAAWGGGWGAVRDHLKPGATVGPASAVVRDGFPAAPPPTGIWLCSTAVHPLLSSKPAESKCGSDSTPSQQSSQMTTTPAPLHSRVHAFLQHGEYTAMEWPTSLGVCLYNRTLTFPKAGA